MILKYYIIGNSDEIKRDRPPLHIIICKVVNVDYKANVCLSDFSVLSCHVVNIENLFMIQKSCDKKSYELPLSFVRFLSTVFTVQIFNAHIFYQQQGSIFLLLFSPNHAVACFYFSNVVSILKIVRVSGLFRLSRDSSRIPSML